MQTIVEAVDTDEAIFLIHEAEGFMPLYDSDGEVVVWIIPEGEKVPYSIADSGLRCEHGGKIDFAECDHAVCEGRHSDGQGHSDGCDLPALFVLQTYAQTYWQPAEYESRCSDCYSEPDYESYFEDRDYDDSDDYRYA